MSVSIQESKTDALSNGSFACEKVIDDVCGLNWSGLSSDDLINVAWTYYYFSIQFYENIVIARGVYPDDEQLEELDRGERDTDNLSPYPGVVAIGERVDHHEFMRRALDLSPVGDGRRRRLEAIGKAYLDRVRAMDDWTRASSLANYEDGGLKRVFRAILCAHHWDGALQQAFKHFLERHIELNSDPAQGHGFLCRHLMPTRRVCDLWTAFEESFIQGCYFDGVNAFSSGSELT